MLGCNTPKISPAGAGGASGPSSGSSADASTAIPDAGFGFSIPDASGAPAASDAAAGCRNLQCRQPACPSGTTSLSGTVYAPNGTLPLYNVAVYVPNAPLDPLPQGMTCSRCGTLASGHPVASALTDYQGHFRIDNVPVGKDVPLVMQVGKWRRQVMVPEVRPCQDNPLMDPELTRLPRNRDEGDLPRVAVTTGSCDPLSCTIAKLGVDPAEFGVSGQDTAFTFFDGDEGQSILLGPDGTKPAPLLWNDYDELKKYDMVAFSCLCAEVATPGLVGCTGPNCRDTPAFTAVTRYLDGGGRIFTSHFEYVWMQFSPDPRLAGAFHIHAPPHTDDDAASPVALDTTFPKGKALADWLHVVDPALPYGQVPANEIFWNLVGTPSDGQVWGRSPSLPSQQINPRFVTINTPVAAPPDQQCGRVVHLDAHILEVVKAGQLPQGVDGVPGHRPAGAPPFTQICGNTLSGPEGVLVFFLFDLAACIQNDTAPPMPPPVVIR
jgi:hypothetical protein